MWEDLKLLSWSRTLGATWLVAILDLLLRVQLNILGRHLFVQQQQWYNLLPAPRKPYSTTADDSIVISCH